MHPLSSPLDRSRAPRGGVSCVARPNGYTLGARERSPLEDPASGEPCIRPEHGPTASIERSRVLVVQRDETVRELIRHALQLEGHEVVSAQTSADGMEVFNADEGRFDLVILDRGLRTPPALQCLDDIRRLRPQVPTIVTTAPHKVASISGRAWTAALVKPFTLDDVVGLVRNLLR